MPLAVVQGILTAAAKRKLLLEAAAQAAVAAVEVTTVIAIMAEPGEAGEPGDQMEAMASQATIVTPSPERQVVTVMYFLHSNLNT